MASPRLDEVAADPEVDEQRCEHEKMSAETRAGSVQECITPDDVLASDAQDTFGAALDALTLAEVEEAAGELHRRVAAALRDIGERRADKGGRNSPRARVASLAIATELGAFVLGGFASGSRMEVPRLELQPSTVAAVVYAAPTIQALLGRLEQDRRLLASLARTLESRLDEECGSPWGRLTARRLVSHLSIVLPARVALELEEVAGEADA